MMTPYWKANFSPFKRLMIKWYIGKIAVGTPYFLPRRTVKSRTKPGYLEFKPRRFGFDFVRLGFKTKWTPTDYRFEWSPLISFVFWRWQIAVTVVPGIGKEWRNGVDSYWQAWLYYEYNTDKTKSPKERVEQARKEFPMLSTIYRQGEEPVNVDWWEVVLKKKYL
jgi:hypothetical protein